MAGDDDGNGIGAKGLADRSGSPGAADPPGEFAIGYRRAERHAPKRPPHPTLERGARGEVEGGGEADGLAGEVPRELLGQSRRLGVFCRRDPPKPGEEVRGQALASESQATKPTAAEDRHQRSHRRGNLGMGASRPYFHLINL